MKVLHVTATGRRRGGEIFAADLTRCLKERGVDQQVIVLRGSAIDVAFDVPCTTVASKDRPLPVRPRALTAISKRTSDWRPDIIQAHGGEALKHVVLSGAASRGHLVYRRIGGMGPGAASDLRRRAYGRLMARAQRVVALADVLREETVRRFHLPDERVITIPNAVDPERLRPRSTRDAVRRALHIGSDDVMILSLGALSWEKDPVAHLAVGAAAMARAGNVVHVFAGDGPMRAQVQREIRERGIDDRCRVLGQRDDVADLLNASDVLLFASRPDGMEGMPAVLIEAGMMGVPVVAFDVAATSSVVVNEVTGYLAPWRDVATLTDRVLRIADDPALGRRLGTVARERSVGFEIGPVGGRYLDLYGSMTA
jgi:glycosyltransferase involved in cell wall biosynthesis